MNACERYEQMISAYLDGELSADEEAELRDHMARCPDCGAMYEAFAAVGEAVRTQDVPDTLHAGIMETVRAAEKASKTQHTIVRLRPILAAAACLVVLVGTVFALKNTVGMGRSAMKSASADAPMAMEQSAAIMTAGSGGTAGASEQAEDAGILESKVELPAAAPRMEMDADSVPETTEAAKETAKSEQPAEEPPNERNAPAAGAAYAAADAVAADSALIVRGKKTGEEAVTEKEQEGLTLSHVNVEAVLQAADGLSVEAGSVIDVLEDDSSMETGKEYLLFLDYDAENDRFYPVSTRCGKVPLDPEEPLLDGGGSDQEKSLLNALRERYCP